jgi:hypothetical protein
VLAYLLRIGDLYRLHVASSVIERAFGARKRPKHVPERLDITTAASRHNATGKSSRRQRQRTKRMPHMDFKVLQWPGFRPRPSPWIPRLATVLDHLLIRHARWRRMK